MVLYVIFEYFNVFRRNYNVTKIFIFQYIFMRLTVGFCCKRIKANQRMKITVVFRPKIIFQCKIMPFLSIWNRWRNNLFFVIWVMFWNISRIYIFFFSIEKEQLLHYFSQFFFNLLFLIENLFLQSYIYS